jgi:hypothetical protein
MGDFIIYIPLNDMASGKDVAPSPLYFEKKSAADKVAPIGEDPHNGVTEARKIE